MCCGLWADISWIHRWVGCKRHAAAAPCLCRRHHAPPCCCCTCSNSTSSYCYNKFANIIKQPSTACDSSFSRGVKCAAHQSVLRMGILGACSWSRLTRNWQQPTCMICSFVCLLMCCCVVCVLCMWTCWQPAGETKKGSAARSRKPAASSPAAAQRPREECKMVLCVNTSLGMGKGKIGEGGQGTLTLLA